MTGGSLGFTSIVYKQFWVGYCTADLQSILLLYITDDLFPVNPFLQILSHGFIYNSIRSENMCVGLKYN